MMNTGRRNDSKEMMQMLIALSSKSWSKPSALIIILDNCFGKYLDLWEDNNALFQMKCPSFKNKNLTEALKVKGLSKKHKQSLCLVWFVHNILWARDINNNISLGFIKLSEDLEMFNNYPWGYESFKMTVKYLLTPLAPKTVNLYGFPWAFMVNDLQSELAAVRTTMFREMQRLMRALLLRVDWPAVINDDDDDNNN
ncbi:hypothetical protein BC332_21012 [Capsicum chinense]|nr:hypothetical protein BC332_21012 [Capsicum chinense]